ETLSVGKNAQFFGFVGLRYQSGRAANRGMLGRAMFSIADEAQRSRMVEAVVAEKAALNEWWVVRERILTLLEDHLYTGLPIDRDKLTSLGVEFSHLGTQVAIHEATAFAAFEDAMTGNQAELMKGWRADPESAGGYGRDIRVSADGFERQDQKQLEDLYAKAFSWLTGTPKDNEIIPIGQPAQFFGFVSIRHKSGHAASRGAIAKDFFRMLNDEQQRHIEKAVDQQIPVVREFLANRHEFLKQLASLRDDLASLDQRSLHGFSAEMGQLEMDAAVIEAEAYRAIRASMNDGQVAELMNMRGEYVIDESQVAAMDMEQRGATLSILCSGCHGAPGQHRVGMPAPSLDGFWDRPIATGEHFEYSAALRSAGQRLGGSWTPELLNQFIANPKKFASGTKMEFQGLLNAEDREALVEYLKNSR
ncbi:MAG: c-type cytochrome, partial [Verrucomicrobiota bacterium]